MGFEMKDMTGSLFKNSYKEEGDNKPNYKGNCMVEGKTWEMAAWLKTDKNGKSYMSFKFSPPRSKDDNGPRPKPPTPPKPATQDDDVPF